MKKLRLQLNRRTFWLCIALLVCLRCALTAFQQAYIWVGGAPLDDELMFRAANAISAGEWLGAYDYLTLSKAMFFPVWLALLHLLHLPYLVAGAALWCGASLLAAFAFAPLWRKKEPAQPAFIPWGCLRCWLFCRPAGRLTHCVCTGQYLPGTLPDFLCGNGGRCPACRVLSGQRKAPLALVAGCRNGTGCGYLDREDAGLFLLPFAAVATVVMLVVLVRARRWLCCAAQMLPYGLLAVAVLTFCSLNYSHYGVFALSDSPKALSRRPWGP